METVFATTIKIGNTHRVKVNRGAIRSSYFMEPEADRTKLRNAWLDRKDACTIPFIYGYRPADESPQPASATAWARYKGQLFAVFFKLYWSKDGTECTAQISTRRTEKDGYVWASSRFIGTYAPTGNQMLMIVSAAVQKNAEIASANTPRAERADRPAGTPRPERRTKKEDWTA